MKRFFVLFALLLIALPAVSQTGNEWINFAQPYYKIPVGKNGIYKLDFAQLASAGVPGTGIDPTTFQLFHRGIEQAIYVAGEADNTFNSGDYIQFYGQQNDGTLDQELYRPSSAQPHAYYNLYSDTTSYFLTYGVTTGKRMPLIEEENTGVLGAEPFHLDEKILVLTGDFSSGNIYGTDVQHSFFDEGEGFTGALIRNAQFRQVNITGIANPYTTAQKPLLELILVGRSGDDHTMEILVGQSLRLLTTTSWTGFAKHIVQHEIEWSDIAADGTLLVQVKSISNATATNRGSISVARLIYPQTFAGAIAADKIFSLIEKPAGDTYIELPGATAGLVLFDITDPDNCHRISTTASPVTAATLPGSQTRKILASTASLVPAIHPVTFEDLNPKNYDYIIITHGSLRRPGGGYADPVQAYADYRASADGGSYRPLIADIQQLYDQFSYGEISPVAIFRFMKYFTNINTPAYLFFIGKGLDVNYRYHRNPVAFTVYKDLVPTAGIPASDFIYTAGLLGTTYEQAIPTGRITASRPEEVAAYLDKVKETEARPYNDLRRKNLLHLSGGNYPGEPERFKGYLEDFASIAQDYFLGAHVEALAKESYDIELINISDEVNQGLSLVTYFGHSSATSLDFDIGKVSDPVMGYNNPGKYPMLLMNGCNIGSYFLNDEMVGEDWILTPQKGAIGFMAHTNFGFESTIRRYAELMYRVGFSDSTFIHKGIGDIQKEVAKRYMQGSFPSAMNITQVQQMILLGDPAVPLFGARKPDLEITAADIRFNSFNEEPITAQSDSFAITLKVRNYGMARPDTLQVQVKRYLNDNTLLIYDSLFMPVKYHDTLTFIIRRGREVAGGNNTFEISIDPDDVISEIRNDNNRVTVALPIPLNGTKNLFPAKFSIVHTTSPTLTFQATDVFSGERDFLLELDTVPTFDSPFKKSFVSTAQVLARQRVQINLQDSTAYYWRTKLNDILPGESDVWTLSSFTYIENGPDGWAQIHFPQFLENTTEGLVKDAVKQELAFEKSITPVTITTYGADHITTNRDVSVRIDNVEYHIHNQGYTCRDNSLNLIAFNKQSTVPYPGVYMTWYNKANRACGRVPWVINNYRPNEMAVGNGSDLLAYIDNVAIGDSVVLFSIGNANYSLWPAAAKTKLGEFGISAAQLATLANGDPVVIYAKKGTAPGSARVFTASGTPAKAQPLVVGKTITGGYTHGSMTTMTIGPALQWSSFITSIVPKEPDDEIVFDLIGVKPGGERVLLQTITDDLDLTDISAVEYPYLQIQYKVSDPINSSPAQLKNWFVLYTPAPEGLLLMDGANSSVTRVEGEPWHETFKFINVSDQHFKDSLTVKVDLFNLQSRQFDNQQFRIQSPAANDTTSFAVQLNTEYRTGLNDITVYVNPEILPEQHYDNNNIALFTFLEVLADQQKPVMEVTIDGRQVLNNDFVSPNPVIQMRIWDENRYVLKETPDGIRIFLTYPCETENCTPTPIELTNEDVRWEPATASTPFKLFFSPTGLPPGTYTLYMEGADARGNSSDITPYTIQFIVSIENQMMISSVYPNPTNEEINFAVTIEGNKLPEQFVIDIMDMQGRVVASAVPAQHQFYVGTNYINWSMPANWPAGLYIYRISTTFNDRPITTFGKLIRSN